MNAMYFKKGSKAYDACFFIWFSQRPWFGTKRKTNYDIELTKSWDIAKARFKKNTNVCIDKGIHGFTVYETHTKT